MLTDAAETGELVGRPGETLAEILRRTLLEMILSGQFARGRRLYPEKLAERFGFSLTPVREALMRLAAEGYIEAIPRRGFHIRSPTAKQVVDLWQVRLGLELMAGELLIERLGDGGDGLAELEAIGSRLEAAADQLTHRRHIELNAEFHHRLIELAGNELLASLYRGIEMQLMGAWIQRGLDSWRARLPSEAKEHRAILAALQGRNREAYARAARAHIARSLQGALADLATQGGDDKTNATGRTNR